MLVNRFKNEVCKMKKQPKREQRLQSAKQWLLK